MIRCGCSPNSPAGINVSIHVLLLILAIAFVIIGILSHWIFTLTSVVQTVPSIIPPSDPFLVVPCTSTSSLKYLHDLEERFCVPIPSYDSLLEMDSDRAEDLCKSGRLWLDTYPCVFHSLTDSSLNLSSSSRDFIIRSEKSRRNIAFLFNMNSSNPDIIPRSLWPPLVKSELHECVKERLIHKFNSFGTEFTYQSTHIEGNTLSIKDTVRIRSRIVNDADYSLQGISVNDYHNANEVQDHFIAWTWMNRVLNPISPTKWSEDDILSLHRRVVNQTWGSGLFRDAGIYRNVDVRVGDTHLIPPRHEEVQAVMGIFQTWLKQTASQTENDGQFIDCVLDLTLNDHPSCSLHPIVLAALVHLNFVIIHPFRDGNGRMARLLSNSILMHYGYPPIIIKYTTESVQQYYDALSQGSMKGDCSDSVSLTPASPRALIDFFAEHLQRSFKDLEEFLDETADSCSAWENIKILNNGEEFTRTTSHRKLL